MLILKRAAAVAALTIGLLGVSATGASASPAATTVKETVTANTEAQFQMVFAGFYSSWLACQEDGVESVVFTAAYDYSCEPIHNGYNLYLFFP